MAQPVARQRWGEQWMDDARCRRERADFEPESFADSSIKVRRARRVCARCPVRADCLSWALTTQYRTVSPAEREIHGVVQIIGYQIGSPKPVYETPSILAGTTPEERQVAARRRFMVGTDGSAVLVHLLPIATRMAILEHQFHQKVTRGPWRVVSDHEYVPAAPEED